MDASVATIDRFEARTAEALAGVTRVRLSLRVTRYKGALLFYEVLSMWLVRRVLAALNDRWLANVTPQQAQELAPRLAELYSTMNQTLRIAEEKAGLMPKRIHRPFLRSQSKACDRIGDVLESLYLAGNEDFNTMVAECVDEIRRHRGGRCQHWRSALAAMRD